MLAALQNILDPAHFKGNVAAMRKAAERLLACEFEQVLVDFMKDPRKRFDQPRWERGGGSGWEEVSLRLG